MVGYKVAIQRSVCDWYVTCSKCSDTLHSSAALLVGHAFSHEYLCSTCTAKCHSAEFTAFIARELIDGVS